MRTSISVGSPVCIVQASNLCGEGAVWHPEERALYWVDINGFAVWRWVQGNGNLSTWRFDQTPTALALTTDSDVLLLVMASGALFWSPRTNVLRSAGFALPDWPEARCNDARVGPDGALWVATMQNNVDTDGGPLPIYKNLGKLYRFGGQGQAEVWRSGLGIGNTIAWSPDGSTLYSGDTLADRLMRFRVEPDGRLSDSSSWCEFAGSGLPDGSAVDVDGYLWNCRHGGGCLLRVDPDGNVERTIPMPVLNPTTCVFGGPSLSTLFVTSAALDDPSHEHAGGVFSIETSVAGLTPNRFAVRPPSVPSEEEMQP